MNHKRIECKDQKAKSDHVSLTKPPRIASPTSGAKDANGVASLLSFHNFNVVQEYLKTLYY